MRRDRSVDIPDGPSGPKNNGRAQGGYDAYFGVYTIDDATGPVTQTLTGALSREHVGADGATVARTLTWRRVG